jgi:isochorismate hydrolase
MDGGEQPMTAAIAPVQAYRLGPDDVPSGGVDWQPEAGRAALLLHDMQEFFLRPFDLQAPPATDLLRNTAELRARCAELGIPVFYTAQPGSMTEQERGLLAAFWGPGMKASVEDRDVIATLRPAGSDRVLTKWRYSAFQRSPLLELLRAAGRDQLIIAGVYAHIGCLMTAVDAFSNDIQPFLVADAVADFSLADHRLALDYAARCCAATPTTASVLASLTRSTTSSAAAR